MIHTLRQFEFLPVAATTACLRSVGGIDLNYLLTSVFRFVFKIVKKHAPGGVCDTFVETAEFPHIVDLQVFYNDSIERVNEFSGLLVSKIMPLVGDPFVNSRHNFTGFSALWRTLNLFGEFSLRLCQRFLFPTEESGVFDGLAIRKRGKLGNAHIDAGDWVNRLWDRYMLYIADKSYKPFPGRRAAHGAGFDLALDRPVFADLDTAYLGEPQEVILQRKPALRVAKRIISELATEARIARLIAVFNPLKESSKSQIYAYRNILQHLTVNLRQKLMLLFELCEGFLLGESAKGFFTFFPSGFALFEKMVVEPATGIKRRLKRMFLCAIGIDPVFECFSHSLTIRKEVCNVKAS